MPDTEKIWCFACFDTFETLAECETHEQTCPEMGKRIQEVDKRLEDATAMTLNRVREQDA